MIIPNEKLSYFTILTCSIIIFPCAYIVNKRDMKYGKRNMKIVIGSFVLLILNFLIWNFFIR